jgi:hypothetical protein
MPAAVDFMEVGQVVATLLTTPLLTVPVGIVAVLLLAVVQRLVTPGSRAANPWVLAPSAVAILVDTGYLAGTFRARQARGAVARGTRLALSANSSRPARRDQVTFADVPVPLSRPKRAAEMSCVAAIRCSRSGA